MKHNLWIFSALFLLASCSDPPQPPDSGNTATTPVEEKLVTLAPAFNDDSAYAFIKKQVEFGPRVPGSKEHARCADYLVRTLKQYGFRVQVQNGKVTTFDNKEFDLKNIIAEYKPELKNRILLCAHWDTRPFADSDTKDRNKPIDGADDGASGVAVLLEIARQIQLKGTKAGIDIVFFDIEDYGQPSGTLLPGKEDTWCLGSQYWSKHLHREGYTAEFGILLDMVGARGSVFPKEGSSMHYAPEIVEKVWTIAGKLGYSSRFLNQESSPNTDDHVYVNEYAKIPTIDIIYTDPHRGGFGPHHHTHNDNLSVIDKNSLKIVGQTVMEVIYRHPGLINKFSTAPLDFKN